MTCAVIKRAELLTLSGEVEDLSVGGEKVVSTALDQILTKKVEYEIAELGIRLSSCSPLPVWGKQVLSAPCSVVGLKL